MTYETVRRYLKTIDFAETAGRLGFTLSNEKEMRISFLGKEYVLTQAGVEENAASDGLQDVSIQANRKSVLVYYAISPAGTVPYGVFMPVSSFTGKLAFRQTLDWMGAKTRAFFSNKPDLFVRVMKEWGAVSTSPNDKTSSVRSFVYNILPMIPVKLVFFPADDEFDCDIRVYYDKTVSHYLAFEPLAVLNGCLFSYLRECAEQFSGLTE